MDVNDVFILVSFLWAWRFDNKNRNGNTVAITCCRFLYLKLGLRLLCTSGGKVAMVRAAQEFHMLLAHYQGLIEDEGLILLYDLNSSKKSKRPISEVWQIEFRQYGKWWIHFWIQIWKGRSGTTYQRVDQVNFIKGCHKIYLVQCWTLEKR